MKGLVRLKETAARLFSPEEKNPYYKGGTAIKNLEELKNHLQDFEEHEATWLASWFDYLGDSTLTSRIERNPKDFKKIILERRKQLKKI